jgi:hypothetical protein
MFLKKIIAAVIALLTTFLVGNVGNSIASAANLIPNGDFEGGYEGFGSDYKSGQSMIDPGTIAVAKESSALHPL